MSQILAWRSDTDGRLFEDKSKYIKHLKKLAKERLLDRKIQKVENAWDELNRQMGQVANITELKQFISDNWDQFFLNGIKNNAWRSDYAPTKHELVSIDFWNLKWDDHNSNSHRCPKGGVTNYMRDADKPKSYPGWECRIQFEVKTEQYTHRKKTYYRQGYGSDYFNKSIVSLGGGGGGCSNGTQKYQYECTLWADDFPVMFENHMKSKTWNYLSGQEIDMCSI
jgi:hypothetical protein